MPQHEAASKLDQTMGDEFVLPVLTLSTQGGDVSERKTVIYLLSFPTLASSPPAGAQVLDEGRRKIVFEVTRRDAGTFEEHPWLPYRGTLFYYHTKLPDMLGISQVLEPTV